MISNYAVTYENMLYKRDDGEARRAYSGAHSYVTLGPTTSVAATTATENEVLREKMS